MSTYRLEIDGSPAEAGAKRIVKSFADIKAAAADMKTGASESFAATARAFKFLADVRGVSSQAITGIRDLTSVLKSFKGPSAASVKNTADFFAVLRGISGFRAPPAAGLASFLTAFTGFKGPSSSAATNTKNLLQALSKASVVKVPGSFNSFLNTLSSYKGPYANAGKNTISLLQALSSFSPPKGINAAIKSFVELAGAIERAGNSMKSLKGVGGINAGKFGAGGGGGKSGFRKLGEDSDFLRNSILRTQTAFNSIGGILGVKFLADASNNVIKIKSQLEAATGSVQQAGIQFQFVREQADKLGLEFTTVAKSYGQLLGSVKGTNVTFKETQDLFRGFATGARALQLSTDDVDGVFRALGQILSKGKLQAEELRGQLGDRLPGAFVRFAQALNLTKPGELDNALKKGSISGNLLKEALLKVARTMEVEFSESATKASKTVDSAFNRLKNSFTFSAAEFGTNGFNNALIALANTLEKLLKSTAINKTFEALGKVLQFAGDHIELVASIAGGIAVTSFLKWATAASGVVGSLKSLFELGSAVKLILLARSTEQAATAFKALNLVMKANVFLLIGTAIAGLLYYLSQIETEASKSRKGLADLGKNSADLVNAFQAYSEKVADNTKKLGDNDDATRKLIISRAKLQESFTDFNPTLNVEKKYKPPGGGFRIEDANNFLGKKAVYTRDYEITTQKGVSKDEAAALKGLGTFTDQGFKGARITDAASYEKLFRGIGEAKKASLGASKQYNDVVDLATGYLAAFDDRETAGDKTLNFSPSAVKQKIVGADYNRAIQPPGISGDVPDKPDKGAISAAKQDAADIKRAVDGFNDLRLAAKGAQDVVQAALEGARDLTATQARAAAQSKVQDVEQTFGDPSRAEAGIVKVAKALHLQAGSYAEARQSLVDYYAKEKSAELNSQAASKAGEGLINLRAENDLRLQNITAVTKGGEALAQANIQQQIQKDLVGVTGKERAALAEQLDYEYQTQLKINRATELGTEVKKSRDSSQRTEAYAKLTTQGLNPDDLDRARRMVDYVQQLNEQYGNDSEAISFLIRLRQSTDAQEAALKRLNDQYDAVRQYAQDSADAIAGALRDAFQQGGNAGDSFLKRVKNLFKELKNITLDFLVFNPLKKYLADTLTTQKSQQFITRGAIGDASGDKINETTDPYTVKNLLSSLTDSVVQKSYSNARSTNDIANDSSYTNPLQTRSETQSARIQGNIIGGKVDDAINVVATKYAPPRDLIQNVEIQKRDDFAALKKTFDYKSNGAALKEGLKGIGSIFKSGGKTVSSTVTGPGGPMTATQPLLSLGSKLGSLGSSIGKIAGAAGAAFGAYTAASGLAKSIGLGKVGQGIAGGAAAGYSLGGPWGAVAGAVLGGLKAVIFKKNPSAYANVTVGENGRAQLGSSGAKDGGNIKGARDNASQGASVFNQIADQLGAYLGAGNYGTFGEAKFKGKDNNVFYSVSGQLNSKGKPTGQYGVDYINGTQDEVQAFALKSQLLNAKGNIKELDPVYQTIAKNSTAKTVEDLGSDLNIGKSYLAFIDAAKVQSDLAKTVDTLNKSYATLIRQSKALGLSENRLTVARDKLLKTYKASFDYDVSNQILAFTDPIKASYNDLLKEYREAVGNAVAVGGNLADVEKLYGLKRQKLLEDTSQAANDTIKKNAQELLTSLTSSQASPLSSRTVLTNAEVQYKTLKNQISKGDFSDAGNLNTYAQNYLDAAKTAYKSTGDFFDVFNDVTRYLEQIGNGTLQSSATVVTPNTTSLDALPGFQSIVDSIAHQNDDLVDALNAQTSLTTDTQKSIGAAIVEGDSANLAMLGSINQNLQDFLSRLGGVGSGGYVGGGGGVSLANALAFKVFSN